MVVEGEWTQKASTDGKRQHDALFAVCWGNMCVCMDGSGRKRIQEGDDGEMIDSFCDAGFSPAPQR
jgi:hypothetical protein